jgi:hypothetical protein
MSAQPLSRGKKIFFTFLLVLFGLVVGIICSELVLRLTILGNREYENKAVSFAMHHLRSDPDVGYLWKANLSVDDPPGWYDQEVFPLVTDTNGFFNPAEAVAMRQNGTPVDIVGLGDSFIHGATYDFFQFFREKGLFFYNMSMSRHCPPQYNIILEKYALPLHPRWILYGIYENDFDETPDFENWLESSADWFTFHSGTWFGPAVHVPPWRAAFERFMPGLSMLEKRVRRQFGLGPPASYRQVAATALSEREKAEKVADYIVRASRIAGKANSSFLCLLIPARDVDGDGKSGHDFHYTIITRILKEKGVPFLDLRRVFGHGPERRELYYVQDAHWNNRGILKTAQAVYRAMEQAR